MTTRYATNRLDMRSAAAFADSARVAESLGYGAAFVPSSPLLAPDPYVLLDRALGATSHLHMGPLIENPVMRHPAVIAGSIATLAQSAPGRVLLGLGVGDTAVRLMGKAPARVAELADATRTIRTLLAGEALDVGAARPARLRHAAPVGVWIAAQGERMLRAAGAVADGVFLRAGRAPGVLEAAIAAVRAGEREAGRASGSTRFAFVLHTVLDDDERRAETVARSIAAGYYEYSPQLFARAGVPWDGPSIHALREHVWPDFHHAADLHAAGEHVAFLPRSAIDAFALYGGVAQVRAQLAALWAWTAARDVRVEYCVLHPVPTRRAREDTATTLERFAALFI